MKRRKSSNSMVGSMIGTGITNLAGISLIGATSNVAAAANLTGTAKSLTGTAVGLQSVALLGPNLKHVKKSFGKKRGYL